MRKHIYLLAFVPIALACNLAGTIKKVADKVQEPTTLTSTDGRVQIVVPGGWSVNKNLNDVAIIQAANTISETYVIVIAESKEDFEEGTDLDQFGSMAAAGLTGNVTDASAKEPVGLQVSGHPALEYQLSGTVQKIKVIYLCTVVETPTHFYQVLTWTLYSRFPGNHETLRRVTQSFKEVTPGAPPPAAPSPKG